MLALWAFLYLKASAYSVARSLGLYNTGLGVEGQLSQYAAPSPVTTPPACLTRRNDDQEFNTCGYLYGDSEKPLVCGQGEYCNIDNQYSVAACCIDASTDSGYDPYACEFTTTCYDLSVSTSVETKTTGRTDKLLALSCSNAAYPYCGTYLFVDIGYENYFCGMERNEVWTIAATPTTQTSLIRTVTASSVITVTPRTTINLGQTTADPGAAVSSIGPSEASDVGNDEQEADKSSSKTGTIAGGVIGGLACVAITAAALLVVWKNRKGKGLEEPAETSFKVLGSRLHQDSNKVRDHQNQAISRTTSPPFPYPHPTEAPSNVAQPPSESLTVPGLSPDATPTYQAYNPHHASAIPFPSSSFSLSQPVLSPQSSFQRPSHHRSHASIVPNVSEVHGESASTTRAPTPTPADGRSSGVRGSRFTELDGRHLSSQSGPVPEWQERQELP